MTLPGEGSRFNGYGGEGPSKMEAGGWDYNNCKISHYFLGDFWRLEQGTLTNQCLPMAVHCVLSQYVPCLWEIAPTRNI